MANYQSIIRLRPELREFIGRERWVYRGDIVGYAANVRCSAFSTDAAGFRHSSLRGKSYSFADCLESERYGLVLGASNIFGFGVAGNEHTIASLLSERFGFPFANVGIPGGNSRNLYCLLLSVLANSATRPAVVVHFNGGDFASFCESSLADPVFGSPNRLQLEEALQAWDGDPDPEKQLPRLLKFTTMWTLAIGNLCRSNAIDLVMGHDTTFFEKDRPSELELKSELGKAWNETQKRQFTNHMRFRESFGPRRKLMADKLGVPVAGEGLANEMTFVDEFHLDQAGTRLLSDAVASSIDSVLRATRAA